MEPSADRRSLEPDEALPALGELVGALFEDLVTSPEGLAGDAPSDAAALEVEAIVVDLPIEIGLDTETVRCAPPTQYTETSVMPVFHHLRLTLVRSAHDGSESGDAG